MEAITEIVKEVAEFALDMELCHLGPIKAAEEYADFIRVGGGLADSKKILQASQDQRFSDLYYEEMAS